MAASLQSLHQKDQEPKKILEQKLKLMHHNLMNGDVLLNQVQGKQLLKLLGVLAQEAAVHHQVVDLHLLQ